MDRGRCKDENKKVHLVALTETLLLKFNLPGHLCEITGGTAERRATVATSTTLNSVPPTHVATVDALRNRQLNKKSREGETSAYLQNPAYT